MSNELIAVDGTTVVLEPSGGAVANASLLAATNAYNRVTQGANFPNVFFVLTATFATAPSEGTTLMLYAQPLLADGTNNEQPPEATRPTKFIGAFVVDNVTTLQAMDLTGFDVPRNAAYWLYNNGTGQAVSAGWKLSATPTTVKAAP